ncbi:MAG: LCP family protein [Oscillospiraceae bacterium]|nr:LCP family protein [Oscillospiraceae bacterium]
MKRKIKTRQAVRIVLIALAVSIVMGALLSFVYHRKIQKTVSQANYTPSEESIRLTRGGVSYRRDGSIRAYLFLGVDDVGLSYENYGRGGRTDTILLFVKDGSSLRILEISRDTMTEVDTYDTAGDYLSTGVMQINMQYSFGDSPRRSAYLTKRTVSALLGGIPISGAVSLNMSGIAPIVDALGGIDVHMEEDCSYIDPAYVPDADVHMNGAEAELFIRWRDKSAVGSNDARMSRHTWFIRQMLEQGDEDSISRLLTVAGPYMDTDMTGDEIADLYACELAETIRLPGETRRGAIHDEFYVNEDELEEILIRLFYRPENG